MGRETTMNVLAALFTFAFMVWLFLEGHTLGVVVACVLMLPALLFTVTIHELGHALAARLLGFDVHELSLGDGPARWSFAIFGVPVTVRTDLDGGGYVLPTTSHTGLLRVRSGLVTLAGPAAPIVFLLVVWPALPTDWVGADLARDVLWFFALMSALENLYPDPGSDGATLLHLLNGGSTDASHRPNRPAAALEAKLVSIENGGLQEQRDLELYADVARELAAIDPPDPVRIGAFATSQIFLDEQEAAVEAAERGLALVDAGADIADHELARLLNTSAYAMAIVGAPGTLDLAEERSRRSIELFGDLSMVGTLGAILVQTGSAAEGLPLLEHIAHLPDRALDQLHTQRFVVLGALELRRSQQARLAMSKGLRISVAASSRQQLLDLMPRLGALEAAELSRPGHSKIGSQRQWDVSSAALHAWLALNVDARRELFVQHGGEAEWFDDRRPDDLGDVLGAVPR